MIGDIRKFRFWCQKVLPLVYDDSLSYYEVLCKVVQYLNKVIEDVNSIPEYIDAAIDEKLSDEHLQELIEQFVVNIEGAISSNNEGDNTNSSADYNIGQMLWWNGKLYRVIRQIDAGDTFIVNTNIALVNFEDLFNDFIDEVKHDISANDDGTNATATQSWTAGTWLWLNDVLYKAKVDITQGNAYVFSGENANVEQITVENELRTEANTRAKADNQINTKIGDIDNLETIDKTAVVSAINEVVANLSTEAQTRADADTAITNSIGDIDDLKTTVTSNLVAAINEINSKASEDILHLTDAYNAVALGVVLNDVASAHSNTGIINTALAEHKYLYFPTGICYTDAPIVVHDKSGIFGDSPYSSVIQTTGDYNGVEVPVSVNDSDGVSSCVVITRILISGTFNATTANNSYGLYFYNYTFNVTCNQDVTAYQKYNSGFGLEFRSSIVKDFRVGAFSTGIYLDHYTAVISISDCMVTTCQYAGIFNYCTDSQFENIYITFCYHGMIIRGENVHLSNSKIYVNGMVLNSSQVPSDPKPVGLSIAGSWVSNVVLTGVDVQNSAHNGIYIGDGCHNIMLDGVVADGNGYTDTTDTNVGIFFYNCFNVSGNISCTDRGNTPTQRIGCFIDNNCHNFNLDYQEYGNKYTINGAGWYTYNMLNHNKTKAFAVATLGSKLTADPLTAQLVGNDGEHLDIHIRATANEAVSAGDTIADFSSVISSLPSYGTAPTHVILLGVNNTTGAPVICDYTNGVITAVKGINSGEIFTLDTCIRIKYWL